MSTPLSQQEMADALLAAGWKKIHATSFWRAPSGFMGASTSHAYDSMTTGTDIKKDCPTCGQEMPW